MSAINKINAIKKLNGNFDLVIIGVNQTNKNLSLPLELPKETREDLSSSFSIEEDISKKSKKIISYSKGDYIRTCLFGYSSKKGNDSFRSLASDIISYSKCYESIAIDISSFSLKNDKQKQSFIEGLVLGSYQFLEYRKNDKKNKLSSITLIGNVEQKVIDKSIAIGSGVCYARDISNHPPNILTPTYIANDAVRISKQNNKMSSKIIDIVEPKDFCISIEISGLNLKLLPSK